MSLNPVENKSAQRRLSRRGLILFGAQAGFMGLLALRLRQLQITEGEEFRLLAEENRINMRLIPPVRGLILDRNGLPVAENVANYRITIVREQAGDVDEVLARLGRIIPLDPEQIANARKELKRRAAFVPVTVAERLSWEHLAAVSANAPALPGVNAEVGLSRRYPLGGDFAHVVGYVGPVSDFDLKHLKDPDPVLQIPRFQIGKVGIENKIERNLRGFAGAQRIEVNATGRVMREIDRQDGQPGTDIGLTIDAGLQNYAQARMEGQSAAAVVMDVSNGDLVALASAPSFDPNKFVNGISGPDYRELLENKYRPLRNKTVQDTFPPGSTFKMVVALAALEAGVVDEKEIIFCRGYIDVGKQRFHCWKRSGHGRVNLKISLKNSCDVFYYEISQRVGIERIAAMARRFGLGERFDLPLNAIAEGLMPTKAWKKRKIKEPWRIGDTLNSAIGQGFVSATPLQLAVMTARLATGRAVMPRLIRAIDGVETPALPAPEMGLAPEDLKKVLGGMFAVSNERGGTAYSTRIAENSMRLAGKTGTSQVRRITMKERASGVLKESELPWEMRDHALFVAYAPYENPRYAISVVVEHGGSGSRFAAPIARDILLEALYGGAPPLSAYPASQRTRISNERRKLKLRPRGDSSGRDRA